MVFYDYLIDREHPSIPKASETPTLQIYNFDVKYDGEIRLESVPFFHFYSPSRWFRNITPIFASEE